MRETKKLGLLGKLGLGTTTILAGFGMADRTKAATQLDIATMNTDQINQAIQSGVSNGEREFTFMSSDPSISTYSQENGKDVSLYGASEPVNYRNDGSIQTYDGFSTNDNTIFSIVNGGNINFDGNGATLTNTKNGFVIGSNPYENVNIRELTIEPNQAGFVIENVGNAGQNAGTISQVIVSGGLKGILYDLQSGANANSPWLNTSDSTFTGQNSTAGAIDMPQFYNYDTEKWEVLGNTGGLENCLFINTHSFTSEGNFPVFETPLYVAQANVTSIFNDPEKHDIAINPSEVQNAGDSIFYTYSNGETAGATNVPGPLSIIGLSLGGIGLLAKRKKE